MCNIHTFCKREQDLTSIVLLQTILIGVVDAINQEGGYLTSCNPIQREGWHQECRYKCYAWTILYPHLSSFNVIYLLLEVEAGQC